MTEFLNKYLENLKLRKQLSYTETEPTMNMELVLIVLVVALMIMVIISFICFLVVLRCQKRKEDRYSDWIRSASIEHLRFTPAEREAHRTRASTPIASTPVPPYDMDTPLPPYNMELATYENFIGSRCNNYLGLFYSGYSNPLDTTDNQVQMTESEKSRNMFQTFKNKNEPKYIYWETRV